MFELGALQDPGILAILGIVIGWILSSISATFRFRNERKADLSKVLSRLLPEISKLDTLGRALDGFKDTVESWGEYERIRLRLWKRHGKFFEEGDWPQLVDDVAKHKPILAIRIRATHELSRALKQNDLTTTSTSSPEVYVKLLSALEVAQKGLSRELRKIARNLGWSAGFRSGLSFEWYLWRRGGGSKMRQKNTEFLKRFHLDVWEGISATSSPTECEVAQNQSQLEGDKFPEKGSNIDTR